VVVGRARAHYAERYRRTRTRFIGPQQWNPLDSPTGAPVPKLCQNPIHLKRLELLFERKQLPQVVDIRHFRME
jgi:hypothetical protein